LGFKKCPFLAGFNCPLTLYISKMLLERGVRPDIHRIFKIMYFADKESLKLYKQPVFGGFCAIPYGPVQDELYKIIKKCRDGKSNCCDFEVIDKMFINPLNDYDGDEFSQSDFECLDKSISENANLTFENTAIGYPMNLLDIASASGLNQDEIEYIKEVEQNRYLLVEE
ncbi:MAG TPA: Panacea domain-containing protein, partial [Caldisericia bacterium]|nr:Panacea domain-containing protein [Caldisericia bacterium]